MKVVLGRINDELLINLAKRSRAYCTHVDAAVAYASGNDHPLLLECKANKQRLAFYGLLDDNGAVAVPVLKELLSWGPSRADVRLLKGHFHAKVIWWRGFGAYVGSANLTSKAWTNNVEAGVFLPEEELEGSEAGRDLDAMFEHLARHAVPVTDELVAKLARLALGREALMEQQAKARDRFEKLFANVAANPGLSVVPAKGKRSSTAQSRFATEWMSTLQLMRGLTKEFAKLGLRPSWVPTDAHPTVHFDQFLQAHYYARILAGQADDDLVGVDRVNAAYEKNKSDPEAALRDAARWWSSRPAELHDVEYIRTTAPDMRRRLSKDALREMDLDAFTSALGGVHAFRMHARQVRNSELGLPADHHETIDERVERLCRWLWAERTPTGKSIRDVLEFVVWGTEPADMEQRLWLGVWSDDYRLPHFGKSSLGEAVGWARPDDFPPRNNRVNKALRALGHDVRLFSNG